MDRNPSSPTPRLPSWSEAVAILRDGAADDYQRDAACTAIYVAVLQYSQAGETGDGTNQTTSLYDWLLEGDWSRPVTPERVAAEWDDLCNDPDA